MFNFRLCLIQFEKLLGGFVVQKLMMCTSWVSPYKGELNIAAGEIQVLVGMWSIASL